ncbi:hypothetical protein [Tardiphaga sp.]|jgi:hypothetical protein|uniref:hypothetical protein n=1 Tax=Tardiphaga sp. TaxID=1926292 RepID=UPI0037DA276F
MRSYRWSGSALLRAFAVCIAWTSLAAVSSVTTASAGVLEERKLPMRFTWVACEPDCRGWFTAVGIVTGDTPKDFDDFAKTRDLGGATVVLDSSGGSVNDAISIGRRWRKLGLRTTVGASVELQSSSGVMKPAVLPQAYCESMCVFLLLSGKTRYVPEEAHVRVHQIWMGDRADDPKAASYTAQDLMIVQRDVGRLAKYSVEMGGSGDLLSLSLSVPPWEDLHRLTADELKLSNLVTTYQIDDVLPQERKPDTTPVASLAPKTIQDRFVSGAEDEKPVASTVSTTKTAEVQAPTGGAAPAK